MAQMVKNMPAIQETQVLSLGREDPLQKRMGTHSVFLPGESHGQRSLVGSSPWGHKESDMTEETQHALIHTVILQDFSARAVWPQSTAFAPSTASLFCLIAICILLGLPGAAMWETGFLP